MNTQNIIRCVSPVDGSIYAEREIVRDSAIKNAVFDAREAQVEWARETISERATVCSAIVDEMLKMSDEIVPELAWQMGRPIRYGGGELRGFEERARYMIDIAESALAPVVPPVIEGFERSIQRIPLGILLVIAPWNYPYLTAVNSVIPALMAGNAVLLKHASQTLLVGERFQMACDRAGLPTGLFRHLIMSHDQTGNLLNDGLVNRVNFTGSVPSGRTIARAAAGAFTAVGLELGGKDPAYVRADANVEFAAGQLVDGAFFNSGQSCCGIERIYVHESVFESFLESFLENTREYTLGNPLDEAVTLGPMVTAASAAFVAQQVIDAENKGARLLIDQSAFAAHSSDSSYMAPQVLTQVDHNMSVMKDESFGPVVGIMSVVDDEEAILLMNDSPFGLTASIWTTDTDGAHHIGALIDTGTVFMNRCDYLDPALAWTGVKDTGYGATLSTIGYDHLTRPKSFNFRLST